jgi:hypothetical protein
MPKSAIFGRVEAARLALEEHAEAARRVVPPPDGGDIRDGTLPGAAELSLVGTPLERPTSAVAAIVPPATAAGDAVPGSYA